MTASPETAARGLIRSMLVIGSAQAVNILLSVIRMKVLAALIGPAGIGLLSIYSNLLSMVTQAAGLGMGSSGVREIASARGEEVTLSRVRRVLFVAHLVQGALAMLAVWLLRMPISEWLFGDVARATEVGLLGMAIFLVLLASAQTTLLQGLRRIDYLGRVTIVGALAATVAGLLAIWAWGEDGLLCFLLVQPLATVLIAAYFTRHLSKPLASRFTPSEFWHVWKSMAQLGLAFMFGGLATTAVLLVVRSRIMQDLGLDAAGQFAAAWGITMTYVGFLLGAMGADFYPRLTEVIRDRTAAIRLMNEQAQLSLAVGGPLFLLLIAWAPWIIELLYSEEFLPAARLLQWQTVGNVFKLASWAIAFSVVATARSKTFLFLEISFNVFFLAIVWFALPTFGIISAGPAFLISYIIYLFLVNIVVRRIFYFRWQPLSLWLIGLHAGLSIGLLITSMTTPALAVTLGPLLALGSGLFGLHIVLHKIGASGRFAGSLAHAFAKAGWPINK